MLKLKNGVMPNALYTTLNINIKSEIPGIKYECNIETDNYTNRLNSYDDNTMEGFGLIGDNNFHFDIKIVENTESKEYNYVLLQLDDTEPIKLERNETEKYSFKVTCTETSPKNITFSIVYVAPEPTVPDNLDELYKYATGLIHIKPTKIAASCTTPDEFELQYKKLLYHIGRIISCEDEATHPFHVGKYKNYGKDCSDLVHYLKILFKQN